MAIGRLKGSPNRIGAAVKSNVIAVFDKIGGREKMAEWARKNLGEFYKLCASLIPTESHIDVTRQREVREMTTEELLAIVQAVRRESRARISHKRSRTRLSFTDIGVGDFLTRPTPWQGWLLIPALEAARDGSGTRWVRLRDIHGALCGSCVVDVGCLRVRMSTASDHPSWHYLCAGR